MVVQLLITGCLLGMLGAPPSGRSLGGALGVPSGRPPIRHRGWYSRNYLPHFDEPGYVQSITFRLADAVPAEVVAAWKAALKLRGTVPATDPRSIELRRRLERYEDAGHGACWLGDERIAAIVENALLHFDGERYHLLAWCVMPNHVHVLIETKSGVLLDGIVHSWKSFTANEANRLLGRKGAFWQREYFDRFIRDEKHLRATIEYIEQNPVKAGLVRSADQWRFSSAAVRKRADGAGAPG
jgi:REP element-mobilizing transposase RayT